jgi:hypothetical protein
MSGIIGLQLRPPPTPPVLDEPAWLDEPPLLAEDPPVVDEDPPVVDEDPPWLDEDPAELLLVPAPLPLPLLLLLPPQATAAAHATTTLAMPHLTKFMTCPSSVKAGTGRNRAKLSLWVCGNHSNGRQIPKRGACRQVCARADQHQRIVRAIFERAEAGARQHVRPSFG